MQSDSHPTSEHAAPEHGAPAHGAPEHGAPEHGAPAHGAPAHGAPAHGEHGAEHHQEFNWFEGIIGVKEGVEPSLLWRTPDMPTPFAAVLFNTALLFGLLFKFARAPVAKALVERRKRIMRGIDEAAAMKEEARRQLDHYRQKLDNLDSEVERVKREMREGAEFERKRILDEAASRRTRLEQEARVLIQQELEALRDDLTRETSRAALRSARELLVANTSTDDHRRLCEEYLETLRPQTPRQGGASGRS
jgi:F0F1-type ATP synthase membrane subunit b/b'